MQKYHKKKRLENNIQDVFSIYMTSNYFTSIVKGFFEKFSRISIWKPPF